MKGQNNGIFLFIAIIVGVIILLIFLRRKLKRLVLPNVFLIDGAPKTGKTALCLTLCHRIYKKNLFKWYLGKPLYWLRYHSMSGYPEKPMFYTNIPVTFMHNRLSKEIIFMERRIPPKSVVFIDEASLFADSLLIKDNNLNYHLTLFCKLFGHISRGGTMGINTQQVADLHFAFKRVLGRYLYIYQTARWPFISISQVREMVYSDDTHVVNDINEDAELSMRKCIFFNKVYKEYDCYCYSVITDSQLLEVDYDYTFDKKDLKARKLISFNIKLSDFYASQVEGKVHDETNKA